MPNRDKKSMIFGVGIGICAAVLILFITYIVQRQSYISRINELTEQVALLEGMMQADEEYYNNNADEYTENQQPTEEDTPQEPLSIVDSPTQPEEIETTTAPPQTTPEPTTQPETTTAGQGLQIQPVSPVDPSAQYVWVHIPANIDATAIAGHLLNAGVISDVSVFVAYLVENNFTVSLMAGNFQLPINGDFEVILSSILAGGF